MREAGQGEEPGWYRWIRQEGNWWSRWPPRQCNPEEKNPPRGREKKEEDEVSEDEDNDESSEPEFQKATEAMCIDGGASLHSHRQLK